MAFKRKSISTIAEVTMEIIADELRKHNPDPEKVKLHYQALGEQLRDKYKVPVDAGRTVQRAAG